MPALGHQSDVLEIKYVLGSNKALKTLKFTVNMLLTYKVSFMISQLRRRKLPQLSKIYFCSYVDSTSIH